MSPSRMKATAPTRQMRSHLTAGDAEHDGGGPTLLQADLDAQLLTFLEEGAR